MPVLTDTHKKVDALVLWEAEPRYNREKVTFKGVAAAGEVTRPVGSVLKTSGGNYLQIGSGETAAVAILLEQVTVTDDGTAEVAVIVRGPCLINQDELEHGTSTGGNITSQLTALRALGIKFVREPLTQEVATV
jgi:hypothetical protein